MIINKRSILTGKMNTMDLPVTIEQIDRFNAGELVQRVFPELTDEQREFILNGITPQEWKEHNLDTE